MGLNIDFLLRLPGDTPLARVDSIVADLYRTARALPFHDSHASLFAAMAGVATPGEKFRRKAVDGTARGILVELAEKKELAILAFLLCVDDGGERREWRWGGEIRTHLVAQGSEEHFLASHIALVALFDRAVALGADVTIKDAGDYWLTRDRARLLQRLRETASPLKGFAAGLARAMGRDVC